MKIITIMILLSICLSVFSKSQVEEIAGEFLNPSEAVRDAYNSKDIIRIKEVCQNISMQDRLIDIISKDPESEWKEKVIIELLLSPWYLDRISGQPTPAGTPPIRLYHIAVDFLAPHLPEEDLRINDVDTYRKLSSFDERKRLTAKYKEIVKSKSVEIIIENEPDSRQPLPNNSFIPPGNDFTSFPEDNQRIVSTALEPENKNQVNISPIVIASLLIGASLVIFGVFKYTIKLFKINIL